EPFAAFVARVIAVDEAFQGRIADHVAEQTVRLRVLVAHAPTTAPIERKPAMACRHVRPFRDRPYYRLIHPHLLPGTRVSVAATNRDGPGRARPRSPHARHVPVVRASRHPIPRPPPAANAREQTDRCAH